MAKCDWLEREGYVGHVTIVRDKVGSNGKLACIQRRVQHLFDDNWYICEEAREANLNVYHISRKWGHSSLKASLHCASWPSSAVAKIAHLGSGPID